MDKHTVFEPLHNMDNCTNPLYDEADRRIILLERLEKGKSVVQQANHEGN